jgi:hypothetical protein
VFKVRSAGHVITGRSTSSTVTVNVHSCAFPELSIATQYTHVPPSGNADPLGQSQKTSIPGQLSFGNKSYCTTDWHWPGAAFVTIGCGQVTRGGSASCTITLNAQLTALLLVSVA